MNKHNEVLSETELNAIEVRLARCEESQGIGPWMIILRSGAEKIYSHVETAVRVNGPDYYAREQLQRAAEFDLQDEFGYFLPKPNLDCESRYPMADFVVNAKQDIPRLIATIRFLKQSLAV